MKSYYVWSPDRDERFCRVEWALTDASGEATTTYNGIPPERLPARLRAILEGGPVVPHFVYYMGLMVIASSDVVDVVKTQGAASSVTIVPVELVRKRPQKTYEYFLINPLRSIPLLDHERSIFKRSAAGVYRNIKKFVVRDDIDPQDEILICDEIGQTLFSARLVDAFRRASFDGASFTPLEEYRTLL